MKFAGFWRVDDGVYTIKWRVDDGVYTMAS